MSTTPLETKASCCALGRCGHPLSELPPGRVWSCRRLTLTQEGLMHRNAPLTPEGRLRLVRRIEAGWTGAAAAESMNVSRQCAHKWWRRYRDEGPAGLEDRSSRPLSCPHHTPARVDGRIGALRQSRKLRPARLAGSLGGA